MALDDVGAPVLTRLRMLNLELFRLGAAAASIGSGSGLVGDLFFAVHVSKGWPLRPWMKTMLIHVRP